jgi:hypothetical protein
MAEVRNDKQKYYDRLQAQEYVRKVEVILIFSLPISLETTCSRRGKQTRKKGSCFQINGRKHCS